MHFSKLGFGLSLIFNIKFTFLQRDLARRCRVEQTESALDDRERLFERPGAVAVLTELVAVFVIVPLEPPGADAENESPA